jgi:hypothetical protein
MSRDERQWSHYVKSSLAKKNSILAVNFENVFRRGFNLLHSQVSSLEESQKTKNNEDIHSTFSFNRASLTGLFARVIALSETDVCVDELDIGSID